MNNSRASLDITLAITVLMLLIGGMIMVFNASSIFAETRYNSMLYFYKRQLIWGALSFIAILFFSHFDYKKLNRPYVPSIFVVLSLLLLIAVMFFGVKIKGAQRWFHLFFFNFQPSEFAKLSLIIYVAHYLSADDKDLSHFKTGFLPLITIVGIMLGFIVLQPDMSTTLMIAAIIFIMLFVSRIPLKHLLALGAAVVPVIIIVLSSASYQMHRLVTWYQGLQNPRQASYQVYQSLIGLGRGGFMGQGLAESKQKFLFLPDSHTDFIFSIVGEELGWFGASLVLIGFMIILYRGYKIVQRAQDGFGKFLALGITINVVFYALVNAGVVSMLLPATGLPMPFISYGGSNLLILGISIGLLLNISRQYYQGQQAANWKNFKRNRERLYKTVITVD